MKAKLIKKVFSGGKYEYSLILDGEIGTYAKTGVGHGWLKLSMKNCDEIFGVVDVEKLADHYSKNLECLPFERARYKEGFNKAMELNKDKVFTLEQVLNAFYAGWISKDKTYPEAQKSYKGYLERHVIQPTEIEVEIEMTDNWLKSKVESCPNFHPKFGCSDISKCVCRELKFDSEGCIILKKI
jgi:hypothetical protein